MPSRPELNVSLFFVKSKGSSVLDMLRYPCRYPPHCFDRLTQETNEDQYLQDNAYAAGGKVYATLVPVTVTIPLPLSFSSNDPTS